MTKEEFNITEEVKIRFQTRDGIEYRDGTILKLHDTRAEVKFNDFEIIMYVEYDRLKSTNSKFF